MKQAQIIQIEPKDVNLESDEPQITEFRYFFIEKQENENKSLVEQELQHELQEPSLRKQPEENEQQIEQNHQQLTPKLGSNKQQFEEKKTELINQTDKYGFFISEQKKPIISQQNMIKQLNARQEKWRKMLPSLKKLISSKSSLLKERGRKGIPDGMRMLVWPYLAEVELMKKNASASFKTVVDYEYFLQNGEFKFEQQIKLDVHRTFPNNINFQKENICAVSLANVLNALSKSQPKMGYCQGLNFLTAALLVNTSDENSFWILYSLMTKYNYMDKYINPVNVNKEFFVFENLIAQFHPDLLLLFKKFNIDTFFYATEWFMTLFSSILPLPLFYRFFDVFLIEGVKTAYRCGLTILEFKKKQIHQLDGFEEILMFLKSIEDIQSYDIELFIKIMSEKYIFSKTKIFNLEQQYFANNKDTKATQ